MLFSYAIFSTKHAQRHNTTVADNAKVEEPPGGDRPGL